MNKFKKDFISKLYNLNSQIQVDYFFLPEEQKLQSSNLSRLSGHQRHTNFLISLQDKLSGVPELLISKDMKKVFKIQKEKDMQDILQLKDKILLLLNNKF